jgi:hypothetical protein
MLESTIIKKKDLSEFIVSLHLRTLKALKAHDKSIDDTLLLHVSLTGWKHMNLTGIMCGGKGSHNKGKFKPLRPIFATKRALDAVS